MRGVFIGGYMHSGTTLLRNILNSHPECYTVPSETRFLESSNFLNQKLDLESKNGVIGAYNYLYDNIVNGFNTTRKNRVKESYIDENSDVESSLFLDNGNIYKVFSKLLDELTLAQEKNLWVEKTPTNVYYIDEILEYFHSAKVIIIQRDIRDIYSSKKHRYKTVSARYSESDKQRKKLEKDYNLLFDGLSWKKAIKAALRQDEMERVLVIPYEDLCHNPELWTVKIFSFIGVEDMQLNNLSTLANTAYTEQRSTIINAASVGIWRSKLSDYEVAFLQWFCYKELQQLKLPLTRINILKKTLAKFLVLSESLRGFLRISKRVVLLNPKYLKIYMISYLRRITN